MNVSNLTARARIHFFRKEEGGRSKPIEGKSYATLAEFPDGTDNFTLLMAFDEPLNKDRQSSEASIDFLVNDAPHHLLKEGTTFVLWEGPQKVAEGTVTKDSDK